MKDRKELNSYISRLKKGKSTLRNENKRIIARICEYDDKWEKMFDENHVLKQENEKLKLDKIENALTMNGLRAKIAELEEIKTAVELYFDIGEALKYVHAFSSLYHPKRVSKTKINKMASSVYDLRIMRDQALVNLKNLLKKEKP